MVDDTSLCVPARPSGSQGHLISPHADASEVSPVARAIADHHFDFSTCLSLLEESFSSQAASALQDPAVTQSDAYFNLGAFGFDDGRRCGVFQRTEQFSDVARFLNAFLRLQFSFGFLDISLRESQCAHTFTHRRRQRSGKLQSLHLAWQLFRGGNLDHTSFAQLCSACSPA